MARDPLDTGGIKPGSEDDPVGAPQDDGLNPFAEGGDVLGSAGITDTRKVPNPAEYDEELAEAQLVEAGVGEPVPGVNEAEVERTGITPVADTTGSATPNPMGGGGDMTVAFGGPVTGDPDHPDNVDTSVVPEGYETGSDTNVSDEEE